MSFEGGRTGARPLIAVLTVFVLALAVPAQSEELAPAAQWLRDDAADLDVLVYPPRNLAGPGSKRAHPVTVMLHGMCDEPENECPYFAQATTRDSWLVCPRARLRCDGGGSIWSYTKRHDTVEKAVALVREQFPERVDESRGRTLIGFSLGAIFGMDIAHRAGGRYPRVLLIGAKVHPSAPQLKRQGVERIVFASGDYDMMKWHMVSAAKRAGRHGVEARFVSLGKVGHWFPGDMPQRTTEILAWLHAPGAVATTEPKR